MQVIVAILFFVVVALVGSLLSLLGERRARKRILQERLSISEDKTAPRTTHSDETWSLLALGALRGFLSLQVWYASNTANSLLRRKHHLRSAPGYDSSGSSPFLRLFPASPAA